MDCRDFKVAAGKNWQAKAENACTNCQKCKGNFPLNPDDLPKDFNDEVERLYETVAEIIYERNAGFNFEIKSLIIFKLVVYWRRIEREIAAAQSVKLLNLLEYQNEILKFGFKIKV